MNVKRLVTASITVGDQPIEAELSQLKQDGYTGVVNLRNDGEPEQPMSTTDEGNKVRALGMDYVHYGVGSTPLTVQDVTAVCDFIDKHSQAPKRCWFIVAAGLARSRLCCSSRRGHRSGPTPRSSPRARRWAWRSTAG